MAEYFGGTIEKYDDRNGYGYIVPDEPATEGERYLVHRRSLRDATAILEPGMRVLFKTTPVPTGTLAADVHLEAQEGLELFPITEHEAGEVSWVNMDKGFGFIRSDAGDSIFFHVSSLPPGEPLYPVGTRVTFDTVRTERGLKGVSVTAAPSTPSETSAELLAKAILARDSREYDEAKRLYELGMKASPSIQLITSYAAMEKNRNRRRDAMDIYRRGIARFPGSTKLREDAGILAASIQDYSSAIDHLTEALKVCRTSHQAGEKGVLLALGRVYSQIGTLPALKKAIEAYNAAENLFATAGRKTSFPKTDLLSLNLARIRTQHQRGALAFDFIKALGFTIVRATPLENITTGADLLLRIDQPEIIESYGISDTVLMRCMFKADLAWADIQSLDEQLRVYGSSQLADEQLAFVIVASVPEHVQHALFQRAEEKGKLQPAIIPISQSEIETGQSALSTLREVLDRWLYRRDLFAVNFPVSGRRFFGRGKPLAEIREAIASGSPAGVFGLRKVGKTSLLQETERRARENGDIVVYLDLLRLPADIKDMRWIYWKIGNELFNQITSSPIKGLTWRLGGKFRDFLDVPKDYEVGTRFDADITKILTALKTAPLHPRPKIVLLFDEVERLLPNRLGKEGLSGFFDFFSYFRGVAQESNDFVLIVTAANASIAEAAQFDGRDNPVFNFFREIYLPLLEPTECATMLSTLGRGMGIRFDDQALQDIYRLTGGHPFLSRQLASFVALRYRTRPLHITSKMIDDAINEYLEFSGEDFSEILERLRRDYPEELTVFLSIANAARGVPIEEVRQAKNNANLTIKHLVGYQLVKVDNNRIEPTIGLMSRWLSKTGYLHTGTL